MSGTVWNSVRAAAVVGQRLQGGAANDALNGGLGNDILVGMGGNDQLTGGLGTDTAVFAGSFAQFRLDSQGKGDWRVQDTASKGKGNGQGTDFLSGVERVAFDDRMVLLVDSRGPVATDDSFALREDDKGIVLDILGNDSDPDGDAIFLFDVGEFRGGSLSVVGGKLLFTADPDWYGTTSFTYTIKESFGALPAYDLAGKSVAPKSATATVTITVAAVNDAPVGPLTGVLADGTEDTVYDITADALLAGFTDVEKDKLGIINLQADTGTLSATDHGWSFQPKKDYNGPVTLTYTVSDGQGGTIDATRSFTLAAVNDAPTGSATTVLADGLEDTAFTVSVDDLVQGFSDVENDTLSVTVLSADHGTASQNDDGSWTVTPEENYFGPVVLTYTVSDGQGETASGTLGITLAPVNDAPVGPLMGVLADGIEDTVYIISADDLLAGFTDVENDPLEIRDLTVLEGNGSLHKTEAGWTFTPLKDWNGSVTLSYTVFDGQDGSGMATRSFALAPVNDAPVGEASAKLANGAEDEAYTILATDLLAGFSDVDGDTLSVQDLAATNGTLKVVEGGWLFTPAKDYNGTVSLTYSVSDGHGELVAGSQSFFLEQRNDQPGGTVTISGLGEVGEMLSVSSALTDIDHGIDFDTLTYVWQRGGDASGVWTDITSGTTYTVQAADLEYGIRVVATYTDGDGNTDNSKASAALIPFDGGDGGAFNVPDMQVYIAVQDVYANLPLVLQLSFENSPNWQIQTLVTDQAGMVLGFDQLGFWVAPGSGLGSVEAYFESTDSDLGETVTATLTRTRVAAATGDYNLTGKAGWDIFLLPTGGGTVDAGAGNDYLEVQNSIGAVLMQGGADDDILVAINNTAPVTLLGGAGTDMLTSIGNSGGATLDGGAGPDILYGDNSEQNRQGTTFVFHKGEANLDMIVDFKGGATGDRIQLVGYDAGATFTQSDDPDQWVITDGNKTETISIYFLSGTLSTTDYAFV